MIINGNVFIKVLCIVFFNFLACLNKNWDRLINFFLNIFLRWNNTFYFIYHVWLFNLVILVFYILLNVLYIIWFFFQTAHFLYLVLNNWLWFKWLFLLFLIWNWFINFFNFILFLNQDIFIIGWIITIESFEILLILLIQKFFRIKFSKREIQFFQLLLQSCELLQRLLQSKVYLVCRVAHIVHNHVQKYLIIF